MTIRWLTTKRAKRAIRLEYAPDDPYELDETEQQNARVAGYIDPRYLDDNEDEYRNE